MALIVVEEFGMALAEGENSMVLRIADVAGFPHVVVLQFGENATKALHECASKSLGKGTPKIVVATPGQAQKMGKVHDRLRPSGPAA